MEVSEACAWRHCASGAKIPDHLWPRELSCFGDFVGRCLKHVPGGISTSGATIRGLLWQKAIVWEFEVHG